jgi:aconitase B
MGHRWVCGRGATLSFEEEEEEEDTEEDRLSQWCTRRRNKSSSQLGRRRLQIYADDDWLRSRSAVNQAAASAGVERAARESGTRALSIGGSSAERSRRRSHLNCLVLSGDVDLGARDE